MIGNSGPLPAVLTVASVALLSLLTLLCLRCKRKPKIIQEDRQIYNPPTFQRGGSQFAVMRSTTVTKTNQISSSFAAAAAETPEPSEPPEEDEQSDYINIDVCGSVERDYVNPISESLYVNEKTFNNGLDDIPGVYGNVFPSIELTNDDDDYENSDFLKETDEADYVNQISNVLERSIGEKM
ncbi:uncharacterized protein LOC102777145 isoform X2 [Neolamprologus brichardi]|uniref:uncharacterized protein LOC102777145 isoform X2 n=1 Tax=Neolamprologus brichardi TaxID=32507 RepID=UPI001643AB56|nr:uncharacterized protein LOC102777145 isoform X2 [Neolamprologus brichardi]